MFMSVLIKLTETVAFATTTTSWSLAIATRLLLAASSARKPVSARRMYFPVLRAGRPALVCFLPVCNRRGGFVHDARPGGSAGDVR